MRSVDEVERTGVRRRNEVAKAIADAIFANDADSLGLYGPAPEREYRGGWSKQSAAVAIADVFGELKIDLG
jgi:hypothetical protein